MEIAKEAAEAAAEGSAVVTEYLNLPGENQYNSGRGAHGATEGARRTRLLRDGRNSAGSTEDLTWFQSAAKVVEEHLLLLLVVCALFTLAYESYQRAGRSAPYVIRQKLRGIKQHVVYGAAGGITGPSQQEEKLTTKPPISFNNSGASALETQYPQQLPCSPSKKKLTQGQRYGAAGGEDSSSAGEGSRSTTTGTESGSKEEFSTTSVDPVLARAIYGAAAATGKASSLEKTPEGVSTPGLESPAPSTQDPLSTQGTVSNWSDSAGDALTPGRDSSVL